MIRRRKYYGLGIAAHKRQPGPYKGENRRLMREEWATFCTAECPHEGRQCDRGPCKEFKARFGGGRKDV